jgi:hypothetical protein
MQQAVPSASELDDHLMANPKKSSAMKGKGRREKATF